MIKTAVFGCGNIGRAVIDALSLNPDFELCGIVDKLLCEQSAAGFTICESAEELGNFDVAILASPSRTVPELAASLLSQGISTADGFDIHSEIPSVRRELDGIAKAHNAVSILSAGWDPGSDSIIRTLFQAMAPRGITYTNFGPGVSMGHTVAAKSIDGVKDALSVTIPTGTGLHRRMVYVELKDGCSHDGVASAIKADAYFCGDETHVIGVSDVSALRDLGHGVHIERKGSSGTAQNQLFSYDMRINNPALTAQILVASARASLKQKPGCYTLIEIPPVDLLDMDRDEAVEHLV